MNERRTWILGLTAVVTTALALLLLASTAMAGPSVSPSMLPPPSPIPGQITYQGRLTDPSGNPVPDGMYEMTFTIYDDETAGNALWSQSFTGAGQVQVEGGQFTVYLGIAPGSPIHPTVFTGGERWLGVQVGADPEMTPRTLLTSVPYAIRAETLRAGGITSYTMSAPLYKLHNTDPGGHALVAEGNVHIEGNLSWSPKTGHLSVSPAAFQPFDHNHQYERNGHRLHTTSGQHYYAPVYLPDHSTVTKMTFYYDDGTATTGVVSMTLKRRDVRFPNPDVMAEVASVDAGPYGDGYDDTIDYAQVNNDIYIYWLYAKFDGTLDEYRKVRGVIIEYTYTTPH